MGSTRRKFGKIAVFGGEFQVCVISDGVFVLSPEARMLFIRLCKSESVKNKVYLEKKEVLLSGKVSNVLKDFC